MAIAKGEFGQVKSMVEQNDIDVDSFSDDESYTPLLMKVLTSYGMKDENKKLTMLRYFLERGANTNCKSGYNSLHLAVQNESLVKAIMLIQK